MKIAAAMLKQWHRENPARLLQAALLQAERLAQMAPELEALRAENASLHQQLEVKTKRLAQLETALEEAQPEPPTATSTFRGDPQKRAVAPKRPGRKRGHPGTCRPEPEQIDESLEVKLCSCPQCGGSQFKDHNAIEQLIEDIRGSPHVTRLTTYHATCVGCDLAAVPNILCRCRWRWITRLRLADLALAADLNQAKGLCGPDLAPLRDCWASAQVTLSGNK